MPEQYESVSYEGALAMSDGALKGAVRSIDGGFLKVAVAKALVGIGWALYAQAKRAS